MMQRQLADSDQIAPTEAVLEQSDLGLYYFVKRLLIY